MKNHITLLSKTSPLLCHWTRTTDPRAPLICTWMHIAHRTGDRTSPPDEEPQSLALCA